jgi:hypothetical protein
MDQRMEMGGPSFLMILLQFLHHLDVRDLLTSKYLQLQSCSVCVTVGPGCGLWYRVCNQILLSTRTLISELRNRTPLNTLPGHLLMPSAVEASP